MWHYTVLVQVLQLLVSFQNKVLKSKGDVDILMINCMLWTKLNGYENEKRIYR